MYYSDTLITFREGIELKIADLQQENCENDSKIQNIIASIRADVCQNIVDLKAALEVPLSVFFTAFKEDDYYGKGEENLKFTGCSLNTNDVMDPR